MRDEKEERKKQARSNKQTRQSNTAHPRQCTSDIYCIHGYPEMFHGCLVGLQYCTVHVHVLRIYNVFMDIQSCLMDALLVCTTVNVHVLQIYIVSMDIQRYSMDALLVCSTVHVFK